MRSLTLAAITMVTALGASGADAQRLGRAPMPGASYPMPGAMPAPVQMGPQQGMPRPPMMQQPNRPYLAQGYPSQPRPGGYPNQPGPGQSYPGQSYPQQPRPGQGYPGQSYPGQSYPGPRPVQTGGGSWGGNRWGGSVGGHWSGGMNAPGGWNAYRRPSRGYRLPSYWVSPNFYLGDYGSYGLYAPPQGYGWQRYYDDAVLVDGRGRVRDSVYGLDWDGGYGYDQGGYDQGGYAQSGYVQSGYAPYPQPLPPVSVQGNVTTYSTGGGYASGAYVAGGYYYPGATTTVVTIQGAPSVTTTTTEYVETTRTRYVTPRRVVKKRYYRPAPRCVCRRPKPVEQPILGS